MRLVLFLVLVGCATAPTPDPDQGYNEARFFEIAADAETQSQSSVSYIKKVSDILIGMVKRNLPEGHTKNQLIFDINNVWLQSANELLKGEQ